MSKKAAKTEPPPATPEPTENPADPAAVDTLGEFRQKLEQLTTSVAQLQTTNAEVGARSEGLAKAVAAIDRAMAIHVHDPQGRAGQHVPYRASGD